MHVREGDRVRIDQGLPCRLYTQKFWACALSLTIMFGVALALLAMVNPAWLPPWPVFPFLVNIAFVASACTCAQASWLILPTSVLVGALGWPPEWEGPWMVAVGIGQPLLFAVLAWLRWSRLPLRGPRTAALVFAGGGPDIPLEPLYAACCQCRHRHWYAIARGECLRVDDLPACQLVVDDKRIEPVRLLQLTAEDGRRYVPCGPHFLAATTGAPAS